ncbi:MAG: PPC domain-containing protein [Longimicrobiales bacterium]|nr:PPC domain-containing protein [Longimicrobiales bacterium]
MLVLNRSLTRCTWAMLALTLFLGGCIPVDLWELLGDDEGVSVLTLLETDGREIRLGEEALGALSASDYTSASGTYLEAWSFEGQQGQTVSVDLISGDFDAYLYIVGPGLGTPLSDDDSGGACHARIDFTVLETGTFRVVASAISPDMAGPYRLRLSDSPQAAAETYCGGVDTSALTAVPPQGSIEVGTPISGTLTGEERSIQDGRPIQVWELQGTAGETLVVSHRSDDFDAYLYLTGPGLAAALTDDDSGGDLDSQITVTFPETGTYTVGAAALSTGASGAYSLTVTRAIQMSELSFDGRSLRLGSSSYGTLSELDPTIEGRPVQAWAFRGDAGQGVTIDMLSQDFDSYLHLMGPGITERMTDDDSAGNLDSRIEFTLPESGIYRVVASSLGSDGGSYEIRVR